jgi:hypothetical protein
MGRHSIYKKAMTDAQRQRRRRLKLKREAFAAKVAASSEPALDWFPTLMAAAGNPNITDQLLKGVPLGERTYKNHLDGYNQMDLLTAVRLDDFKFAQVRTPEVEQFMALGWPFATRRRSPSCS